MYGLVLIFVGGGLGSLSRYGITKLLGQTAFPYGTLWTNIISCLLLGFLIGLASRQLLSNSQKLLFMTGFCGGFSTFSTFSGEIVGLYENGHVTYAIVYLISSILTGILSIVLGIFISRPFQ